MRDLRKELKMVINGFEFFCWAVKLLISNARMHAYLLISFGFITITFGYIVSQLEKLNSVHIKWTLRVAKITEDYFIH